MYRDHSIGVVVPAYNEAGFVGEVIETVPEYVDRVYVIDDGSTDETWTEIKAAANRLNSQQEVPDGATPSFERRVVPIKHERNHGVGGAIKSGYQRARTDRIDITAVMGGDGQMRPDHLRAFLDPIVEDQAAYTKGNRLLDPDYRSGMPPFRLLGNYLLSGLTRIASGYWGLGDPQNGYTAISLHALDEIALDEMYEFYGYCNDLLVTLNVNGFTVADVPRQCNYADEESDIRYHTYIPRVSGMLLTNFLWRLREQYLRGWFHPAGICYTIGIVTSIVGTLLAVSEAVSNGIRSRGVTNAVKTTVLGGVVFLLGTAFERLPTNPLGFVSTDSPPEPMTEEEQILRAGPSGEITGNGRKGESSPDRKSDAK